MDSETKMEEHSKRRLSVSRSVQTTTDFVPNTISFKASALVFVIYMRFMGVIRNPKESKPATRRRDGATLAYGLNTCTSSTITTRVDDTGTKREVTSEKVLDWKKLLPFLAKNIHAESNIIFFHSLYGNTKLPNNIDYHERINRVQIDVGLQRNSHNSESLFLEQFKSWKEVAGNNANLDVIKMTLAELGHNDIIEILDNYIRSDAAYMDVTYDTVIETFNNVLPSSATWISSLPCPLPQGSKVLHETHSKLQLELPKSVNTVTLEHDSDNGNEDAYRLGTGPDVQMFTLDNMGTSVESDQAVKTPLPFDLGDGSQTSIHRQSIENQTNDLASSKKSRKRKREFSSDIGDESLLIMVNHFLTTRHDTRKDIHRFSTKAALDELFYNCHIRQEVALQLKYKEYCEIEGLKTKRGEDVYIIYIGKESYLLKQESYEKLKHYAEHARSKVVNGISNEVSYMFIDINGTPLYEILQETSDD